MRDFKCPGQDQRYWKADALYDINCPHCGYSIEFFKDEPFRICTSCKKEVRNTKIDLGCAKWCKYAAQCLGTTTSENGSDNIASMCERLKLEMRQVFGSDQKRINHALKVLEYTEKILMNELGADPLVVRAAAILHDIGILEAERKYNSTAGNYQESEGVPIAAKIMKNLHIEHPIVEHVCRIIGSHHSAKDIDTPEFRIVWDADWLVNWNDVHKELSQTQTSTMIEAIFKTVTGKNIAARLFLQQIEA
jgi:putative nucleotidyltransferase with HDIG domain